MNKELKANWMDSCDSKLGMRISSRPDEELKKTKNGNRTVNQMEKFDSEIRLRIQESI